MAQVTNSFLIAFTRFVEMHLLKGPDLYHSVDLKREGRKMVAVNGGIRTHDLNLTKCLVYRCATTKAHEEDKDLRYLDEL